MAEDREVLREVWQGRIPAAITLSPDDVHTMAQPDPYHLMLPRPSYLTIVIDKVRKHFSKFVHYDKQDGGSGESLGSGSITDGEIWFDYEGTPIKWHIPVGVLYDQFCVTNVNNLSEMSLASSSGMLPWALTVHFSKFPEHEILHCESREAVESHFMSCIKEADQIKHGGRVISAMQKKDHNQLWQGLQNDKFDQFWAVNRRLMEVPATSISTTDGGSTHDLSVVSNCFKHIPVRMYEGDKSMLQKLIKPIVNLSSNKSTDKQNSEGNDKPSADDVSISKAEQTSVSAVKRLATLRDLLEDMLPDKLCDDVNVVTQGITPDLDTPLQWMSEHLSYPDNFLHIIVK